VTAQKYLVLAGVALFASAGDSLLSRGMKDIGGISLHNLSALISAVRNPWIILGILFLIAFFAAYMSALSWADLTYVLPATSIGYVVLALIAKFVLHEQVTMLRWVGILLISAGVSFVAGGPALTPRLEETPPHEKALEPQHARSHS
jgi:drug/metabolite transporter (DMT)-like permease